MSTGAGAVSSGAGAGAVSTGAGAVSTGVLGRGGEYCSSGEGAVSTAILGPRVIKLIIKGLLVGYAWDQFNKHGRKWITKRVCE